MIGWRCGIRTTLNDLLLYFCGVDEDGGIEAAVSRICCDISFSRDGEDCFLTFFLLFVCPFARIVVDDFVFFL